jgi:hypothetical protein
MCVYSIVCVENAYVYIRICTVHVYIFIYIMLWHLHKHVLTHTHTKKKKKKIRASALVHVALTEVHGTRPYPRVSRKHIHPLHTGPYVVDLQPAPHTTPKPLHPHHTRLSDAVCMLLNYRAVCCRPTEPETIPKQFHPLHSRLYVADLQGLKPPQNMHPPRY